jgi:hypothetical protein
VTATVQSIACTETHPHTRINRRDAHEVGACPQRAWQGATERVARDRKRAAHHIATAACGHQAQRRATQRRGAYVNFVRVSSALMLPVSRFFERLSDLCTHTIPQP